MLQDLLPCLNGELRSHQLEGVKWLGTNYFSGLNGILSDELLHDRQVQVVGLIALLKSKCVGGPFLIVASPGSLSGWAADLHRLLPQGLLVHNYSSAADSRNMLGLICSGQGKWYDHGPIPSSLGLGLLHASLNSEWPAYLAAFDGPPYICCILQVTTPIR